VPWSQALSLLTGNNLSVPQALNLNLFLNLLQPHLATTDLKGIEIHPAVGYLELCPPW